MAKLWIVLVGLFVIISQIGGLRVGVGIADVTGPAADVTFMGYAKADQKGAGLHLRQFARAFILDDDTNRIVYVTVDVGMMSIGVKQEVLKNLKKKYGSKYTETNVILSGTHTHSAPGGFLRYLLFDIPVFGFVKETYNALIDGITLAIVKAHKNVVPAKMYFTKGQLLQANINRSPTAYLANPKEERDKYDYDVDKDMVQIRFISDDSNQKPLGAIHWFAVHPTSMNNTNRLISSDNVGYASLLFELSMNNGSLPGKGSFVGAFASTNLGDVSPNIRGPRCMNTGSECDISSSACEGRREQCVASGPGKDMFDSTRIIAERLFNKGKELWSGKAREITGPIKVIHQYVHMPSQRVIYKNPITQKEEIVRGCPAAMGYSFAAGTTDGPGAFGFEQGTTTDNPLWNMVRDFLSKPSKEQIACHGAKPILLNTGEMSFPYQWQPNIVAIQLAFWGSDLAVAAVPGEFTTMSGRRLRNTIRDAIEEVGGPKNTDVVIAGLSNIYTDYITTPEEYKVQRYEAASTVYGPHTLTIYQHRYAELAKALVQNRTLEPGKTPPEIKNVLSLVPPVLFDVPGWRREFGDCVLQPASHVRPGDTVIAKFVAGHPRNNNMHGKTFLTVERLVGPDQWEIIATDANWETKFKWNRRVTLGASSEATIEWELGPDVAPGEYRIRHFGYYKYILGGTYPYEGISKSFQVI